MSFWRLSCLMVAGMPLTSLTTEAIFQAAKTLVRDKKSQVKLKQPKMTGFVQTKGEAATLGSISGIKFSAEIDADEGSTKVTFIIPEEELMDETEGGEFFWGEDSSFSQTQAKAKSAWMN